MALCIILLSLEDSSAIHWNCWGILITAKLFWGIYCWFLTVAQHIGKGHPCTLTDWIPCHTLSSWMAYHQCGFFNASQTAWCRAFVVTLWAAEWFFIGVDSFVCLQCSWLFTFVITPFAAKGFFISVDSFMSLQNICQSEHLVTLWAADRFITSVNSLMSLQ